MGRDGDATRMVGWLVGFCLRKRKIFPLLKQDRLGTSGKAFFIFIFLILSRLMMIYMSLARSTDWKPRYSYPYQTLIKTPAAYLGYHKT